MKTPEEWVAGFAPSIHEYSFDNLERFVKKIQLETIESCTEIANSFYYDESRDGQRISDEIRKLID